MNDYRAAVKKLNDENLITIKKMRWFLGTYQLNPLCYKELLNDIVGMALESQERGEKFSETIGMDYESFCHELVKNVQRQSVLEKMLGLFVIIIGCISFIIPGLFLLSLIFPQSMSTVNGVLLSVSAGQIIKYTLIALILITGWTIVKRSVYRSTMWMLGIIISLTLLTIILLDNIAAIGPIYQSRVEINIFIWMGIFAAGIALCVLAKHILARYHYNKKD